jgi:hypothetical protein
MPLPSATSAVLSAESDKPVTVIRKSDYFRRICRIYLRVYRIQHSHLPKNS